MKNYKLTLLILTLFSSIITHAQNIEFTDANFKSALLRNIVDSNFDGEISIAEAERVRILNIDNSLITNLSGIEHFTNLDGLSVKQNRIESVDLSQNRMLTRLDISSNKLRSIDLSANTELKILALKQNELESIDLSNHIELEKLFLSSNSLSFIDVTNNVQLDHLALSYNSLTTIDLSRNRNLERLTLLTNELNFIDLSQNIELEQLEIGNNNLECINLQENINLKRLDLRQNNFIELVINNAAIEVLDFRSNPNLKSVYLDGPEFQTNPAFGLTFLNCPDLETICINEQYVQLVEDLLIQPNYNSTNAVVTSNCEPPTTTCELPPAPCNLVAIPDPNFEQALLNQNIDTDGLLNGTICREDARFIHSLYMTNENIRDLTGIEAFLNLKRLAVVNNNLTVLDLSQNTLLRVIVASNNQISATNFSQNTQLERLIIRNNQISTLDIGQNTQLEFLQISNNQLSTIDVSQNTRLTSILASFNDITNIDLTNNTDLEVLSLSENELMNLDVIANTNLLRLFCSENNLTNLDVSANTILDYLYCNNNKLINLDISNNMELSHIYCQNNKLESLNLRNNNNTSLVIAKLYNNPDLSCIMVDDIAYANSQLGPILGGAWTKDTTASFSTSCSSPRPGPVPKTSCSITEDSLTMKWASVPNIQGYQVEITSTVLRRIIKHDLPAEQTSLTIKRIGDMSWRVRPVIANQGIWSEWIRNCEVFGLISPFITSTKADKETLELDFKVFPNPLQKGNILFISNGNQTQNMSLYNLSGQLVFKTETGVNDINTSNFKPGVYILKIQKDDTVITRDIVIY